jgi:hypothetical protein
MHTYSAMCRPYNGCSNYHPPAVDNIACMCQVVVEQLARHASCQGLQTQALACKLGRVRPTRLRLVSGHTCAVLLFRCIRSGVLTLQTASGGQRCCRAQSISMPWHHQVQSRDPWGEWPSRFWRPDLRGLQACIEHPGGETC